MVPQCPTSVFPAHPKPWVHWGCLLFGGWDLNSGKSIPTNITSWIVNHPNILPYTDCKNYPKGSAYWCVCCIKHVAHYSGLLLILQLQVQGSNDEFPPLWIPFTYNRSSNPRSALYVAVWYMVIEWLWPKKKHDFLGYIRDIHKEITLYPYFDGSPRCLLSVSPGWWLCSYIFRLCGDEISVMFDHGQSDW